MCTRFQSSTCCASACTIYCRSDFWAFFEQSKSFLSLTSIVQRIVCECCRRWPPSLNASLLLTRMTIFVFVCVRSLLMLLLRVSSQIDYRHRTCLRQTGTNNASGFFFQCEQQQQRLGVLARVANDSRICWLAFEHEVLSNAFACCCALPDV
jgi:hypothetical protein